MDFPGVNPAHVDVGSLPGHEALDEIGLFVVEGQPEGGTTLVKQVHARGGFQLWDQLLELGVGGAGHLE